jgi:uncharacterized protein
VTILIGIVFSIIAAAFAALAALGLPGTWLVIMLAAIVDLIEYFSGSGDDLTFGWMAFAVALVLATVAEIIELVAGAASAKTGGTSRRGTVGALIGGFIGGIVGTFLLPIPLLGTLAGAALGAAGGALVGELTKDGAKFRDTLRPATGAAAGRIAGTVIKIGFAVAIWLQMSIAAFI